MRFAPSSPSPLANSWRRILWAVSLVPALVILGWSAKNARRPRPDAVLVGQTPEKARQLQRILNDPSPDRPLRDDEVRVLPQPDEPASAIGDGGNVAALLSDVSDNTFGISAAEKPAYDNILSAMQRASEDELAKQADVAVPFAVLMLESDRFRGRVLSITGEVRRLQPIVSADENSTDPLTYEAWVFTPDSGLNPYRIVLAEQPANIPVADRIAPPIRVRVTGCFFKRYSYATSHDFHTAPLLLAKTLVRLSSPPAAAPSPTQRGQSLTVASLGAWAVLGILAIGLIVVLRNRRPNRIAHRDSELEVPDFRQFVPPSPIDENDDPSDPAQPTAT